MEGKQKCRYIGEERGTCVKEKKQEGKKIFFKKKKKEREREREREREINLESEMYG